MALPIRTRLTLWYSLVTLTVLATVAIALSAVHKRLEFSGIDRELRDTAISFSGVVRSEIDEQHDLEAGVREALEELQIPATGVAVLDANGRLLADRASGVPPLTVELLRAASETPRSQATADGEVRLRASEYMHGPHAFRLVVWTSLVPFGRERAALRNTLWLGIPIALIVAASGGWILGWRALRPLASMARQANAIDDRRLDDRLTVVNADDELGVLAAAFNGLLDRLAGSIQAQRRFMADASHQLRTPVSVARTAAQVTLGRTERTAEEYRESLGIIADQTERLSRMVEDMFTLALADAGARRLQLGTFYFDELLQSCVRAARVLADQRQIRIEVATPAEVPFQGDESLLRQMILNMLENAVRHTPEAGVVRVRLAVETGRVRLSIADTGSGIPDGARERIFERFVRLDPAGSAGGGGLGLPIARWVAQLHRGSLTLEATGPGGSCFVAVLPQQEPA